MKRSSLTRRVFGSLVASGIALPWLTDTADTTPKAGPRRGQADDGMVSDRERTFSKSLAVYVGNELTEDGSTLLGGFGHEPSSHWIEIVPHQEHADDATWTVGVTEAASIPGELTEIPQVEETAKYIASMYSEYAGYPPPLTNGGLNEHGVAARDIWSPSRSELVEIAESKTPQTGPQYSDLSKAVMERATTAKEAVEIVSGLMEEHGYSTYGGNSHLFADEDEGWVFINYAHPDGNLWAAERLGADEIRMSYFGYILDFPVDHEADSDFMASDRLVSFAEQQGWWDGDGDTLDLLEVYGPGEFHANDESVWYGPDFYNEARLPPEREAEFEEMAPLSVADMLVIIRDLRWATDYQGYGQVAHIRPDTHDELQTLWTAITSSSVTPYVPIPIATEEVPLEFRQHRYMTKRSDSHILDEEWQVQEATRYATREFKRLLYFTAEHPDEFYPRVTGAIEGFERDLIAEREALEEEALALFEDCDDREARDLVTEHVRTRLLDSLSLGMNLCDEIEKEMRERFGLREPEGRDTPGETTPASSQPMAQGGANDMVSVYDEDLHEFPREHGSFTGEPERND